ncbi:hypothetical protein PVK06_009196 [Gossypium arboreum]|uniref:Uncharacterized protein n=1 Tax=Gossypium arboreum TaxID=29729 RepID=A0ABR0QN06_GOSAR|nr:hypothetical protein PVK06_009196 [Gossypium arboreum]
MEKVEHDILEPKDDDHSTIIEHDELNIGVGVELDIEDELTLELSEEVEEPTHIPIIFVEEPTYKLIEYIYF